MQTVQAMRVAILLALLGGLFAGCKLGEEKPATNPPDLCFCLFPLPWNYSVVPMRKGLLGTLGIHCSDTLSRDTVADVSRFGLCDVYRQRKSVYHHRPSSLIANDGEEGASSLESLDAVGCWNFPQVKHWGFSGARPLRFEHMKGGWVLRFFSQCRLGANRTLTPFVVLTLSAKKGVISYRITKLKIGRSSSEVCKIIDGYSIDPRDPDSVLYEDSGTAPVRDIAAAYEKLAVLPEFDIPTISRGIDYPRTPCSGMDPRLYLGNGVLIELMNESNWQMTKGLVSSIGDYWPPLKQLLQETFPNSAVVHDSDLWYRPPVPMKSYNLGDSSVAYVYECDFDSMQYFYDLHPKRVVFCEAFNWGWGDYCGEPWLPK